MTKDLDMCGMCETVGEDLVVVAISGTGDP